MANCINKAAHSWYVYVTRRAEASPSQVRQPNNQPTNRLSSRCAKSIRVCSRGVWFIEGAERARALHPRNAPVSQSGGLFFSLGSELPAPALVTLCRLQKVSHSSDDEIVTVIKLDGWRLRTKSPYALSLSRAPNKGKAANSFLLFQEKGNIASHRYTQWSNLKDGV